MQTHLQIEGVLACKEGSKYVFNTHVVHVTSYTQPQFLSLVQYACICGLYFRVKPSQIPA